MTCQSVSARVERRSTPRSRITSRTKHLDDLDSLTASSGPLLGGMLPRAPSAPEPTRLIRLLRLYTKHLRAFQNLLESDDVAADSEQPGFAAGPTGGVTPSPFHKKQKRAATRTYTRSSWRRAEELAVELPLQREIELAIHQHQGDVFRAESKRKVNSYSGISETPSNRQSNGSALFPIHHGGLSLKQAQTGAKAVLASFGNICQVINMQPGTSANHGVASSLVTLCSSVIGQRLEGWLQDELNEDLECDDEAGSKGRGDDDKIGRLREWLDYVPAQSLRRVEGLLASRRGHTDGSAANSQIFHDHCVNLALLVPSHPARAEVLWPLLQSCSQSGQLHAVSLINTSNCPALTASCTGYPPRHRPRQHGSPHHGHPPVRTRPSAQAITSTYAPRLHLEHRHIPRQAVHAWPCIFAPLV